MREILSSPTDLVCVREEGELPEAADGGGILKELSLSESSPTTTRQRITRLLPSRSFNHGRSLPLLPLE